MYKRYGPKWTLIQKQLGNKTAQQIKDRYEKFLKPKVNYEFSPTEDQKIKSLFETYPHQWPRISDFFVGISAEAIKKRYYAL